MRKLVGAALIGLVVPVSAATARVVGIEIAGRIEVPATAAYPAYERLSGWIRFGVDPELPANRRIVDLALAPKNRDGLMTARANFMILKPADPAHDADVAFVEVSNRGGKASLRYFQNAAESTLDPRRLEHFGDGLLMREGLTVVWVGWQADVPLDDPDRLRLEAPVARDGDEPIRGLVRADWVVDEPANALALGHRGHRAYPPAAPKDPRNVLTRRRGREAPREIVPRGTWRFTARPDAAGFSAPHLAIDGGAAPGFIYELTYVAEDPQVIGLGLAAIRDLASWLKHEAPAELRVKHVLGFGVSQTGRFLRHFLYQGFNADERGRRAFDGLLIHSAGAGRGSFNHRFAQPSRDAHRYSAFFYPTDLFPFSGRSQRDPVGGKTDGLLSGYPDSSLLPRIMYTNTGYEYWGRAAALLHVSADGERDLEPLSNERIYHLASGQHFVDRWPPSDDRRMPAAPAWQGNPLDFLVSLRALAVRLKRWVTEDEPPPASRFPRIADGTLVPLADFSFPAMPGLAAPRVAHVAYRADYGPRWGQGIIDHQPPKLGPAFPALVPAVDAHGNERGGVRNVETRVPLASFTPWSLRPGLTNPGELSDFRGLIAPLPPCAQPGDARTPAGMDRTAYDRAVGAAIAELIDEGFLLPEDRARVEARAAALWAWRESLKFECIGQVAAQVAR